MPRFTQATQSAHPDQRGLARWFTGVGHQEIPAQYDIIGFDPRDIDAIRAALGQRQISYYGFSYGTYLGATYGTLFPQRVKHMVLDGNVDDRGVWYDAQLEQDKAFERNIKFFFAWIAKYDSHYHLGTSEAAVEKAYYAMRTKAGKQAMGGKVGPDELDDTFLNAGYNAGWYEPIADVLSAYVTQGDAAAIIDFYEQYIFAPEDNGFARRT